MYDAIGAGRLKISLLSRRYFKKTPGLFAVLIKSIEIVTAVLSAVISRISLLSANIKPNLVIMAPYVIGQAIIFLPCGFFLLLLFPRLISAVGD